jgi:V-type H+-transporting ATPase subunit a
MGLFSITIEKDSAWEIISELGKLDCLHFLDLNRKEQIFLRTFANIIRRCDEAERRIKYISQNLYLSLLDIFYRNILDI